MACGYIYDHPLVDHLTFAVSPVVSKIFTLGKINRGKYMSRAVIGRFMWFAVNRNLLFVKIVIVSCSIGDLLRNWAMISLAVVVLG